MKKPYLTNSQKIDLFDINFELGYLNKQKELEQRLKLISNTVMMANHYKEINDKQKTSEKKDMFDSFLNNVLALGKANQQNINHILINNDKEENYKAIIRALESEVRVKDMALDMKNKIINKMQNES